ncbi:hypothetical protein DUT91_02235 [Phyllobacterium salinisoli]|uniref:Uncharacterized protein n=1 Tax=Phyllobacterium salinisoli TaxID=1899321 RepID=A0A368KAV4_9HYPH|nr:hypothetical protein [Phyllobacterium salinisoli]RCS25623.1 hypothetical protein DUT91_02235 [Phyllobacterium salinisoli]
MNDATFSELNAKLDELAKKLRNPFAGLQTSVTLTSEQTAKFAELDEKAKLLQAKLRAKLNDAHGVDWELLKLELQNDLMLLTNSFGHWAEHLDKRFNNSH